MSARPTGSTAFIMENAALRAEIERLKAEAARDDEQMVRDSREIERLRTAPIEAILKHPGFTDDEKHIAVDVVRRALEGI